MPLTICIKVPVLLEEKWLRKQLEKLEVFRYAEDGGSFAHVHIYDEESEWSPRALFVATDEIMKKRDWVVYQQVLFEDDNVAYVVPGLGPEGEAASDLVRDPGYALNWIKGTWATGLLALAESLASRITGLTVEDEQWVEETLSRISTLASALIKCECTP